LTPEAMTAALRFTTPTPSGSRVVFDYTISPSLLTSGQRSVFDAFARQAALAGEPWRAFFDLDYYRGMA
jgi:hypothetical protein